jgi:hypothetical protein
MERRNVNSGTRHCGDSPAASFNINSLCNIAPGAIFHFLKPTALKGCLNRTDQFRWT